MVFFSVVMVFVQKISTQVGTFFSLVLNPICNTPLIEIFPSYTFLGRNRRTDMYTDGSIRFGQL